VNPTCACPAQITNFERHETFQIRTLRRLEVLRLVGLAKGRRLRRVAARTVLDSRHRAPGHQLNFSHVSRSSVVIRGYTISDCEVELGLQQISELRLPGIAIVGPRRTYRKRALPPLPSLPKPSICLLRRHSSRFYRRRSLLKSGNGADWTEQNGVPRHRLTRLVRVREQARRHHEALSTTKGIGRLNDLWKSTDVGREKVLENRNRVHG
jgi:hypothetical protein